MSKFLAQLVSKVRVNSSRVYLEEFLRAAATSCREGSLVLDAGSGEGFYQSLFNHSNYHATDFLRVEKSYGKVTYISDLAHLPIRETSYDCVLCTQVLEHLPEPQAVLAELFRVLKPGGELWLTAPLFYQEHEIPYDFYRYTQYGFHHLLEGAGFQVLELAWLEGYYGTLAYQFESAARNLPLHAADFGGGVTGWLSVCLALLLKPVLFFLSLLFSRLDLRHKYTSGGLCKNYALRATRPDASNL